MALNWPWARRPAGTHARAPATSPIPAPHHKAASASGFIALHLAADAAWTRASFPALAREGFMRNPVVHSAVRLIAQTAAAVPWLLYDGVTEHDTHPLLDLLARPNARQAGFAFLEALYGQLLLSGNAYVEHVRPESTAGELHLLRPDRVTVETDDGGWPVALTYRSGAGKRTIATAGGRETAALHLALFHPLDDHYGFPPLQAALMALDTHNAAGSWNKALLDNSARPSGALVYAPKEGGNLTDEQFDRLKAELEDNYAGHARAGRPLLLEGGLDWKSMGLTPKDMDFIQAKAAASRDIALAFGVPPMLLGIPGDNTYSNYREANRAFYRTTVTPLVSRVATEFSTWLTPKYGDGLRLWFDADQVDGLSGERDALWDRVNNASFLTEDEKREAVGYQPRANG